MGDLVPMSDVYVAAGKSPLGNRSSPFLSCNHMAALLIFPMTGCWGRRILWLQLRIFRSFLFFSIFSFLFLFLFLFLSFIFFLSHFFLLSFFTPPFLPLRTRILIPIIIATVPVIGLRRGSNRPVGWDHSFRAGRMRKNRSPRAFNEPQMPESLLVRAEDTALRDQSRGDSLNAKGS
jgi:hypothetical protein